MNRRYVVTIETLTAPAYRRWALTPTFLLDMACVVIGTAIMLASGYSL